LRVMQDFTGDHDTLAGATQRLSGDSSEAVDAGNQLDGLRIAAETLGALPEKKALVYFLPGSAQQEAAPAKLTAAINAAVKANVAFYPVLADGSVPLSPVTIAAGDTLGILMQGASVFNGTYTVRSDGVIPLPLFGDVKAEGLSVEQLQTVLNNRAAAFLADPRIAIYVSVIQKAGK
jgi:Polysaccharide biosynthesis/export protein